MNGTVQERLEHILSKLQGVKKSQGGYLASCPAHNDSNPSLSVKAGDDKVLFYCHAGCDIKDIMSAIGISWADIYGENHQPAPYVKSDHAPKPKVSPKKIDKVYEYHDKDGIFRYQVVRYIPKSFSCRCPDGKGGWITNDVFSHVPKLLYRLPQVLKAKESGDLVFLPEGEKDCDTLVEFGFCATTNPGGANKWNSEWTADLEGANVCIIADNDGAGLTHAQKVAYDLHHKAAMVKIIQLPDLGPKGDVTEWLKCSEDPECWRTKEELLSIVDAAPVFLPPVEDAPVCPQKAYELSDLGNAERLVDMHGIDLSYSHAWNRWLIWDGRRWLIDDTGEIVRRAKITVRSMLCEAAAIDDDNRREKLLKHQRYSESASRLNAMISLAESEPSIPVTIEALDTDQFLLNCLNGVLDLRTGKLSSHERAHYITKQAGASYDPSAVCPEWLRFLNRIFDGNEEVIRFVQQSAGYSLTGDTSERVMFVMHGCGANGKSTFLEVMQMLLGTVNGYAMRTPTETLLTKIGGGSSIPNDVARLKGARFVYASESDEGRRLAEGMIKDMTGGDVISARFLRAEWFDFQPTFKLWLATNHKPEIRGTDPAIWDRIRLIPFNVTIPLEERIPRRILMPRFYSELSGILAWAVEGCINWQQAGSLIAPSEVLNATNQYRAEMDTIADFISDCCVLHPQARVQKCDLHDAYKRWCESTGEYALTSKKLGMRMKERNFGEYTNGRQRYWLGIGLIEDKQPDPGEGKKHADTSDTSDAKTAFKTNQALMKTFNPKFAVHRSDESAVSDPQNVNNSKGEGGEEDLIDTVEKIFGIEIPTDEE